MIVANIGWDLNLNSGGRFVLGLGTQVRAHNERRFDVRWEHPAPRMGEYIQALRAIWRTWETGEKLDYRGKFYNFTLMTPEFSPKPAKLPMVPIMIAAVGPEMQKTAARLCDGVRLHGFATRKYVTDVVRPLLAGELDKAGKSFAHFEVTGGGFIATGPDQASVDRVAEKLRYRVAFPVVADMALAPLAAHAVRLCCAHFPPLEVAAADAAARKGGVLSAGAARALEVELEGLARNLVQEAAARLATAARS